MHWNVILSKNISEDIRQRFLQRFASQINSEGDVVITSDEFRSQLQNKDACIRKLMAMFTAVKHPPKKRKKTKPTRASKLRRVDSKKIAGQKKDFRKKVDY